MCRIGFQLAQSGQNVRATGQATCLSYAIYTLPKGGVTQFFDNSK